VNKRKLINYTFLAGSGVGVRCLRGGGGGDGGGGGGGGGGCLDDRESETASKEDKIAESRGFRGAVIMPEGGGKETGSGVGMTEVVALWIGGVSRLRWASGGKEADSP
jgi:hypothetical protein